MAKADAAGERPLPEGEVEFQIGIQTPVVAETEPSLAFELSRGFGGHDADGAPDRVLSEQRPLGAPQHFDPLDVHQIEHAPLQSREVDTVDVDGHPGVVRERVVGLPDAAHEDLRGVPVGGAPLGERHVRGHLAQVVERSA